MSQPDREQRVGRAFVALADTLDDDYDIIDLLDRLVHYSVDLLAADAAGIMLGGGRGELHVVAASSKDARTAELLQLQNDQGPCMDCFRSGQPVGVPDLHDAVHRWPGFATAVNRSGAYRSVHALPLRLRGQAIGAMNLFHRLPGPLPAVDLALGQALADVATIGILQERSVRHVAEDNEHLQTALNTRVIVEQAKGLVAQKLGLSMDAAFDQLRRYARSNNRRLAELARDITTREVDPVAIVASDARPSAGTERAPHQGRRPD
ncbi:MAG TPA: GAF and ANTAR domain-containing protein [Pseudonocardia sp.]|nr:GAF and ANTAR domain-containing protein [Pseudonocardia sp.]